GVPASAEGVTFRWCHPPTVRIASACDLAPPPRSLTLTAGCSPAAGSAAPPAPPASLAAAVACPVRARSRLAGGSSAPQQVSHTSCQDSAAAPARSRSTPRRGGPGGGRTPPSCTPSPPAAG